MIRPRITPADLKYFAEHFRMWPCPDLVAEVKRLQQIVRKQGKEIKGLRDAKGGPAAPSNSDHGGECPVRKMVLGLDCPRGERVTGPGGAYPGIDPVAGYG